MDELLQEFIAETRETLEALSGEIVAWEADPADRARLDAIFRFVHTVKGSCGFLDLPRLARLSHAAEDVLAAVRDGTRTPDRALVNAVLAIVDRIGELAEAIDAEVALDDSGEDMLIAALAEGQEAIVATAPTGPRAPARSVRLNVDLLDRMMSGMSDMVLARNELARRVRDEDPDPALEAALERLSATVADMRDTVTRTRMQTVDALFSALPRMVRDTAASLGKSVTLHIEGADVELDREMIEVMRDPLVHIIRNSIDHGIEPPAIRRAAGKRENGRLTVSARQSGNQIVIEIADDGQGIDTDRLIAKLVANGARDERELRALSAKAKRELVFEPGLSSKDIVSDVSGRGVGMDIVRTAIEQIGGRIELDSVVGHGLRIAIHVPLTLSIIPTIVVGAGDQRFAIPRQAIEEIVSEHGEAIRIDQIGDSQVVTVRDRRLPLVDLAGRLRLAAPASAQPRMLVIVGIGVGSYAVAVDAVLDAEELVVKPAAPAVMACGLFAGQTLPDTGRPMLLLDCAGFANDAGLQFERVAAFEDDSEKIADPTVSALMFRDLDDRVRAIALAIVDRVESAAPDAISHAAGRLRLTVDGHIIPIAAVVDPAGHGTVGILRLKDGASELAYAIAEPLDIVTLPADAVSSVGVGLVSGVVLIDDQPVELLDPHWLFATHAASAGTADERPLCLIEGDAAWLTHFVRPMLEQAGYRVTATLGRGDAPAAVLRLDEPGDAGGEGGGAVIRLAHAPGGIGGIYRYDRNAILAAVAARVSGTAA
ncbi:chemotaxis protein CheW [Sphingomonas donggukensis]|uniref:histidine kinase n=1 Tax=Sphingomonas donggukensis TaxID=2949093 RepID=A0ABY4TWG1_9SPHN|nr:chemotaxis protein CheW [Sphingomonas donggukensis]URW76754.1 chemotaxis protein CheW [Sphingomonas donggukensis]